MDILPDAITKVIKPFTEVKKPSRLLYIAFALGVGILFEFLFWRGGSGIGVGLFSVAYVVGFLTLTLSTKQLKNKKALWLLIPIFILGVNVALYNNQFVQKVIPTVVFVLLLLFSIVATVKNPDKHSFSLYRVPLVRNIFKAFGVLKFVGKDAISAFRPDKKDHYKKILHGVAISIPILILFLAFFMNADLIFAEKIKNLFDVEVESKTLATIFRIGLLTIVFTSLFYAFIDLKHRLDDRSIHFNRFDGTVTTVVLALINALFLSFVVIQLGHLFGGEAFLIENGITYAQYARGGFFEMVWIVVFAAILLGIIYNSFAKHGQVKKVTALQILLLIQLLVVALSALNKMNIYQEVYGYTALRLYVEWFIYMVFGLLVLGAVYLVKHIEFRKFAHAVLLVGLLTLTAVSSVNVDRLIARQNIQRFLNPPANLDHVELDIFYLRGLSVDTLPAFDQLEAKMLTPEQIEDLVYLAEFKRFDLTQRDTWMNWNWNRQLARDILDVEP